MSARETARKVAVAVGVGGLAVAAAIVGVAVDEQRAPEVVQYDVNATTLEYALRMRTEGLTFTAALGRLSERVCAARPEESRAPCRADVESVAAPRIAQVWTSEREPAATYADPPVGALAPLVDVEAVTAAVLAAECLALDVPGDESSTPEHDACLAQTGYLAERFCAAGVEVGRGARWRVTDAGRWRLVGVAGVVANADDSTWEAELVARGWQRCEDEP